MADESSNTGSNAGFGVDGESRQVGAVYAKAFLGAAAAAGVVDESLSEFDSLVDDVLVAMPKLERVLSSGLVSPEDKAGILDRALGSQASPVLLNFLKVLARHERLDCLRAIRVVAHELADEMHGRVQVDVTTATPLDEASSGKILEKLREMLGGQPILNPKVQSEMLGGVVLRVGDTVFDGSLATQLSQMRAKMINRSIHEIQSRRDRFRHTAGN